MFNGETIGGAGFLNPFVTYDRRTHYTEGYTFESLSTETWDGLQRVRLRTRIPMQAAGGIFTSELAYTFTLHEELPCLLVEVEARYAATPKRQVIHKPDPEAAPPDGPEVDRDRAAPADPRHPRARRGTAAHLEAQPPGHPALPSFDSLDRTHHEVMQTLAEMARLIERLDANGVDDVARTLARQICRFFDGNARAHHAAEEQIVFPSLLASGDAELVQHVMRLQQDHGWLEEDWLELSPQLQAVAEGYSWYDLDALRAGVPIFTELYRDHIALEESMIYPEARRRDLNQRAGEASRKAAK